MKYVPQYCESILEPITTPNKNIQSYFMRTDHSYYVPESQKHANLSVDYPSVAIVIDNSSVSIHHSKPGTQIDANSINRLECDAVLLCRYNLGKYHSAEKCADVLYKVLYGYIKGIIAPRESIVQLIFCDFLSRTEIISMIDILLNQLGFRSIMLLPLSLAASFSFTQGNCAFVYPQGFSFVEDYMLSDSFIYSTKRSDSKDTSIIPAINTFKVDNEDFVEEFSRLKPLDESMRYSCTTCEYREATEEKMQAHLAKEHKDGEFFLYIPGGSFYEAFENRMRYLLTKDKVEKVKKHIYSVSVDMEGTTPVEDIYYEAIKGADLFKRLDCSKECWMTDKEWAAVRIRALKEKLLFFI
ncbi:hypothetical protein PAEPH01_1371 [Pancytospora epiphaga]|nr:hypothetical protein PAEPH01_1371 [Pancytospora epiphaga]